MPCELAPRSSTERQYYRCMIEDSWGRGRSWGSLLHLTHDSLPWCLSVMRRQSHTVLLPCPPPLVCSKQLSWTSSFYRHITVPVPRCSIITPPLWPDYTHRYNATQLCNLGKLLTLSGPQFFHLWDGLAVRVYLYGCYELIHYCCCSVTKLCLSLATPWTEMPGFPDPHHLPEFAQVCVHWIRDGIRFDWNIVGLQSCVNCKCMAKWFS